MVEALEILEYVGETQWLRSPDHKAPFFWGGDGVVLVG